MKLRKALDKARDTRNSEFDQTVTRSVNQPNTSTAPVKSENSWVAPK